ncbi:Uncharacterised protein [Phocoenobacter uteri]|uniref:Uncharacterized protein n=1 Tax=Phocoenobacter uteri TaxID=146806 RepID=A0A379C9Z9_9PAST|nr:hypothetical protein [Phocoenobacter uteri]MDG6881190.1 hypothetical protein [Phocoenobacter uteri]SUB59212.1 Uncharacterised protein [Phocoenobacter uteri]
MSVWRKIRYVVLSIIVLNSVAFAEEFKIKYSSNYVMPAYVHFKNDEKSYSVKARINVPFYKIIFSSEGTKEKDRFNMMKYQDLRNGKLYSISEIKSDKVTYGRVKKGKKLETVALNSPIFDLFTMAYQLSYFDSLPSSFQITNGKKIYAMNNISVNKAVNTIQKDNKDYQEITYTFRTGDKDITVKKYANEKFPRYISYNKDGDNYELEFAGFEK